MKQPLTDQRKKEILNELGRVECQLSPENLTCDGELPASAVSRRARELNARKAALVAELGYEPSWDEMFPPRR